MYSSGCASPLYRCCCEGVRWLVGLQLNSFLDTISFYDLLGEKVPEVGWHITELHSSKQNMGSLMKKLILLFSATPLWVPFLPAVSDWNLSRETGFHLGLLLCLFCLSYWNSLRVAFSHSSSVAVTQTKS